MEEAKVAISAPQTLPPQGRKRPLEHNLKDAPYYKMRVILRDLRPHFLEVLKTPDFRNCKAADEICEGMKVMMDLYKEMIAESIKLEKSNNLPNNIQEEQKPKEHQQRSILPENSTPDGGVFSKPLDQQVQGGSYIVGGSAFGWNFITFNGSQAVFYGRTKGSFRAANPIIMNE